MYNDQSQTYSEFNKKFYSRFPDLTVFNLNDRVNLTKVVLSGFRINYAAKGDISRFMFFPSWKRSLFLLVKRLRNKSKISLPSKREVLFLVSGRFVKVENQSFKVEQFSGRVLEDVGREGSCIVSNCTDEGGIIHDVSYQKLKQHFFSEVLSKEEKVLMKELVSWFKEFESKTRLTESELFNIQVALQFFFIDYCITKRLIRSNQTVFSKCYLVCHYHNEGKIWALRESGIEIIELQHGLISQTDIFYCFPENISTVRGKMLFPDVIWVWGEYWQNVLSHGYEFLEDQILDVGYFPVLEKAEPDNKLLNFLINDLLKVVVCTQVSLHDYFIDYVSWLASANSDIQIVLKPHPAEDAVIYSALNKYPNVLISSCNVHAIFPLVDVHISIYSTTLIESMKYGLKNYSIDVDLCSDYIDEYVKEGISERISKGKIPSSKTDEKQEISRFFNTFDYNEGELE